MTKKFIFLINPISGTASRQALPNLIANAAAKHQAHYEILPTVASGDYHFVRQKVREEKFSEVIICGGDGTVNTVVGDLHDLDINFGILPLGSGNGLAFTAGIPKAAPRALDIIFSGEARPVDGFLVNDSFACMLCGLGFDAQVAHDFANQKTRGLLTYAKQSIKNFFRAKPYPFEIDLGNTHFDTEAYFISIANSNQFGNHVTIAPRASLEDGLLDIVVVRKMSKAQLPVSVLAQIAGNNQIMDPRALKKSGIIYLQTDTVNIKNREYAPMHVDGEPRETAKELRIRILPACFRLIQPLR